MGEFLYFFPHYLYITLHIVKMFLTNAYYKMKQLWDYIIYPSKYYAKKYAKQYAQYYSGNPTKEEDDRLAIIVETLDSHEPSTSEIDDFVYNKYQ